MVVGLDRVALQPGGDLVPAGIGKVDQEPLRGDLARRDFRQRDRRPAVPVLAQDDRDVPGRRGAEVLHAHFHEPGHAGGVDSLGGLERGNRQVGPRAIHAVDQVDLRPRLVEPQQFLAQLRGIAPLPRTEVGNHVDHAPLPVAGAEQLGDRLQCGKRTGRGLRDGDLGKPFAQLIGELRADRLLQEIGFRRPLEPRHAREPQEREELRVDLPGRLGADVPDDLLALREGVGVFPAAGHRKAVVQQHDVVGARAAQQVAPPVLQHGLGHQQHDRGHGRHPQQQQQQLLEHDPSAVLLLAQQQELHRRPVDPPVTHHVDQVDQHGDRHHAEGRQAQGPEQGWMEEGGHEGLVD